MTERPKNAPPVSAYEAMKKFTLSKGERIRGKKLIELLFKEGNRVNFGIIRVIAKEDPDESQTGHRVLFSVPSKTFKRSVDRNLIRRRLREAYRLNKSLIESPSKLLLAYIYTAREVLPFRDIEEKVKKSFARLSTGNWA